VYGQVMQPTLTGIGQSVVAAGTAVPLTTVTDATLYQYVPIYQDDGAIDPGDATPSSIVVGFGQVTWSALNGTTTLTLTRGTQNPVGSGNISGVVGMTIPQGLNVTALFQSHDGL